MKFRLPILFVAVLIGLGAYMATNAFEPPTLPDGTTSTKDESAAKTKKSLTLSNSKKMIDPFNKLSLEEKNVIIDKGTERAGTGKYTSFKGEGIYICKRCNAPLYNSTDKFESHCGWPSFDAEIKGSVKREFEKDGTDRIEITCENCGGHLGHVFHGEQYTSKNTRHCVNSISMKFIAKGKEIPNVIKPEAKEDSSNKADSKEGKNDGNLAPIKKSEK